MRYVWIALLACGCNSILGIGDVHLGGDDGGGTPIDGNGSTIDGPAIDASLIDAPLLDAAPPDAMSAPNVSTKLGKRCSNDTDCAAEAPTCIAISGTTGNMFCTLSCGTSTDPTIPPPNGDAACSAAYDGSSGTPKCIINDNQTPTVTWYCAVACDVDTSTSFGTCPNDLTCDMNACQ